MKLRLDAFSKKLLEYKICGFDTMVFVYLFESHPRYFPLAERAIKLLEGRKIRGITSVISPIEVISVKNLEGKPERRKEYLDFFRKEKNLETMELSWEAVDLVAQLRRNYSLRVPDAVQLATTRIFGAKVFVTNDDRFRKVKDFPILFIKDFAG